jgi:hypothetical protein
MGQLDTELEAISSILAALNPLDAEARGRVLEYVFKRLSLEGAVPGVQPTSLGGTAPETVSEQASSPGMPLGVPPTTERQRDIRSLREEKAPKSANEMAALVAYYLSELAPEGERRETIGTAEITKYFKQARYPLPKAPRATLSNARAAGYFDHVTGGQYKLNPVGYNLVAHGLPRAGTSSVAAKRAKKPKSSSSKKTRNSRPKKAPSAAAGRKSQPARSRS